jgi:rhodanese-related sulfurtransferase
MCEFVDAGRNKSIARRMRAPAGAAHHTVWSARKDKAMNTEQTVPPLTTSRMLDQARRAVPEITAAEARERLERGEVDLLLDVREADEWERGHIAGAVHTPRGLLEWYADPASPYAKPALAGNREARIVVQCATGGRSLLAAETLRRMGYPNVVNMAGGFKEWSAQGFAVV